ncbi:MAG: hypothetical protein AAFZ67_14115 [Planctomycetota bacterium]
MTSLATIVLLLWPFLVVPVLFVVLPVRLSVFASVIFGWLFLPFARMDFAGPIELSKYGACTLTVLACAALFDSSRFARYRFHLLDLPMVLWVLSAPLASLTNGLGLSDAASSLFHESVTWGIPYILGRLYITDGASLRDLAMVLLAAGMAYVPFVLWEARMSPRLHVQLYGFVTYAHGSTANWRFGGWRPVVFQQHGLMLGLLMGSIAVLGAWMWWTGSWRRFRPLGFFQRRGGERWGTWSGIARRAGGSSDEMSGLVLPTLPVVGVLIVVALLCRSLNALMLMAMIGGALVALRNPIWPTRIAMVCLLVVPILYAGNRVAPSLVGVSVDKPVIEVARLLDPYRAASMQFRVESEAMLAEKAMQRPVFGWGGWGRSRVKNDYGEDVSVTDGLWIIALGTRGLFGLATWYLSMTAAVWVLVTRYPPRVLSSPEAAPAVGLACVMLMFVIDCLPNAMVTVIHPMIAGGLSAITVALAARADRPRVAARGAADRGPSGVPAGAGA